MAKEQPIVPSKRKSFFSTYTLIFIIVITLTILIVLYNYYIYPLSNLYKIQKYDNLDELYRNILTVDNNDWYNIFNYKTKNIYVTILIRCDDGEQYNLYYYKLENNDITEKYYTFNKKDIDIKILSNKLVIDYNSLLLYTYHFIHKRIYIDDKIGDKLIKNKIISNYTPILFNKHSRYKLISKWISLKYNYSNIFAENKNSTLLNYIYSNKIFDKNCITMYVQSNEWIIYFTINYSNEDQKGNKINTKNNSLYIKNINKNLILCCGSNYNKLRYLKTPYYMNLLIGDSFDEFRLDINYDDFQMVINSNSNILANFNRKDKFKPIIVGVDIEIDCKKNKIYKTFQDKMFINIWNNEDILYKTEYK